MAGLSSGEALVFVECIFRSLKSGFLPLLTSVVVKAVAKIPQFVQAVVRFVFSRLVETWISEAVIARIGC